MHREKWLESMRERYRRAIERGDTKTAEGIAAIVSKPLVPIPDIAEIVIIQGGTIHLKDGATIEYRETYFEFDQLAALVRQWRDRDALQMQVIRRAQEFQAAITILQEGAVAA